MSKHKHKSKINGRNKEYIKISIIYMMRDNVLKFFEIIMREIKKYLVLDYYMRIFIIFDKVKEISEKVNKAAKNRH